MEILIYLILVMIGIRIFVFLVDTLLGKSSISKKRQRKKLEESINKKIENNDELNADELEYLGDISSMKNLLNDLAQRNKK